MYSYAINKGYIIISLFVHLIFSHMYNSISLLIIYIYIFTYFMFKFIYPTGSIAYKLMEPVINSNFLLKDIEKLSPTYQTYGLEVFHRVILTFASKTLHFFYWSMVAR